MRKLSPQEPTFFATMRTQIDHLVIGAANLQQGVAYVKHLLGVDIPYGGAHKKMGTHNHLMQLGNDTFLEVIAVNHDAEAPNTPRWYGLDDPFIQQQIQKQPTLLTWVINTKNISELIKKAVFSLGKSELISRGQLNWHFGLPEDGRLLGGGILPYAIEWQTDIHPATNMADLACSLDKLVIYHPYPTWLQQALASVEAMHLVEINTLAKNETPYLEAQISTPSGLRILSSQLSEDSIAH